MGRWTDLLLVLAALAVCPGGSECPIECFCDNLAATCTGDHLISALPTQFGHRSDQLTRIELHTYVFGELSVGQFHRWLSQFNLTALQELTLRNCGLSSLSNDTFLSQSDPLNLRSLDLSQNKFEFFAGGTSLRNLRLLDLSSNRLQQVRDLKDLSGLESINLRENQLTHLEGDLFKGLTSLQYINLDSNTLTSLSPGLFSDLPALTNLILSGNPNLVMSEGLMTRTNVLFLDLSLTGFRRVPLLSLTQSVRDLRLSLNNISIVSAGDFDGYPNLELLVLDENGLEEVEEDAFGRLEYLTRLWLNGNKLRKIPQNLPPSLQSLQLEDNSINSLSPGDFSGLIHLRELTLGGNLIGALPPSVFGDLTSLTSLDLSSNAIDTLLRDSLANLSSLLSLDISSSPLKVIVTGAFSHLTSLTLLSSSHLNSTFIEFTSESFQPLTNLQVLSLEGSPALARTFLQESGLNYFPALIDIDLRDCSLDDINLVSVALSELVDLGAVKLGGNPWDCQDFDPLAIHEFLSKGILQDENSLICQGPESAKGMSLLLILAQLNISATTVQTTTTIEQGTELPTRPEPGTRTPETHVPLIDQEPTATPKATEDLTPTRSYFFDERTDSSPKSPPNPSPRRRPSSDIGIKSSVAGLQSKSHNHPPGKTKTNDDAKAIIDGKLVQSPSHGGSIDGFPASDSSFSSTSPKLSFLRSFGGKSHHIVNSQKGPNDNSPPMSGDLLLKTVLISGVTVLISAVLLLTTSYIVFRYIRLPLSRNSLLEALGRKSSSDSASGAHKEEQGMAYSRLEFDSVELSGIENRLYFENPDIYHIT